MRYLKVAGLGLAVILSVGAVTRVYLDNIASRYAGPSIVVVTPDRRVAQADIGTGLRLDADPIDGRYTINSTLALSTARYKSLSWVVGSTAQSTIPLADSPVAGSLVIVRDGIELSEGIDYAVNGSSVVLVPDASALPGSILKVRYVY